MAEPEVEGQPAAGETEVPLGERLMPGELGSCECSAISQLRSLATCE